MTKILLPIEERKYGDAQIDFLFKHELPAESEFTLMTVIKPLAVQDYGFAVPSTYLEAIVKEDEKAAKKLLEEFELKLKTRFPKSKVTKRIEMGSAGSEILREAKDENFDWIIMGSHGRSGLDKFFLGSVSQSVVNRAHCSVTIVRLPESSNESQTRTKEASVAVKS